MTCFKLAFANKEKTPVGKSNHLQPYTQLIAFTLLSKSTIILVSSFKRKLMFL